MSKLTRADVEILDTAHPAPVPDLSQWLIRIAGGQFVISAWNRIDGRGRPAPETVALYADADGRIDSDGPDVFDETFVPVLDHEVCITALLAYLNGEPPPVVERPAPEPKRSGYSPSVPAKSVAEELLEMAANDPGLDDDTFTVLARAIEGRPLFDE